MYQNHNRVALALIRKIVRAQAQDAGDQVEHRVSARAASNDATTYDIECRVTNPDTDWDSGWYWADVITVGPRGRVIA